MMRKSIFKFLYLTFCLMPFFACSQGIKADSLLTAEAFRAKLSLLSEPQLLDVRTTKEFSEGHLDKAKNININSGNFQADVAALDKQRPIFVYCLGGGRSAKAVQELTSLGFTRVYDLKGGILSWKNNGFPTTEHSQTEKKDLFNEKDFQQLIAAHPAVLIDFYADWCTPCKQMEPVLEKLRDEYNGKVLIYRLNIDEAKTLTKTLKIDGLPFFQLYKKGKLTRTAEGYQDKKALRALLN